MQGVRMGSYFSTVVNRDGGEHCMRGCRKK